MTILAFVLIITAFTWVKATEEEIQNGGFEDLMGQVIVRSGLTQTTTQKWDLSYTLKLVFTTPPHHLSIDFLFVKNN